MSLDEPASTALVASSASGDPIAESTGRSTVAPIAAVVVLEDRAHVTRRGAVELPLGVSRLEIADVSPVIVDKTLRATLVPRDEGSDRAPRVFDVRVRRARRTLAGESPAAIARLEADLREAERAARALSDERARLRTRLEQLENAQRLHGHETAADVAYDRAPSEESLAEAKRLAEAERETRRRFVDHSFELEDSERLLNDLQHRLARASDPSARWAAAIEIDLEVAAPGGYDLEIDYVAPNACWRPSHVARLDASGRLHFAMFATVWQNTGEAWSDVALSCTTERPSLGVEPPRLTADRLGVRRKPTLLEVESRDQQIQTAGLGSEESPEPSAVPLDSRVPGVDDGGETQHLACPGRASVPSDGGPHRLPLFEFETDARTETLVAAELVAAAIVKTTQANRVARPLLAGPVDLIMNGGLIGRTSIRFVAAQEIFALGWGPDPEVRVRRDEEEIAPEPKLLNLSSWIVTTHHVRVRLSNVGPRVKTLTIRERVPVSEIEKVQIVFDASRTTGKLRPDADGFVSWTITLGPFGRAMVELWYDVKKSKDVVGAP